MPYAIVPLVDVRPSYRIKGGMQRSPLGFDLGGNYILLGSGAARRALIWTPTTISDPRAQTLGDSKEDALPANRRALLQDFLEDRTFQPTDRLQAMIAGLLMAPRAGKWNALRPSKRRQRFEILLGPDKGKLFWTQAARVAHSSVTYTDDFNRADGDLTGDTFSGGTNTWADRNSSVWAIVSNAAACVNIVAGSFPVEGSTVDVDTADYFVQFTITNWVRNGGQLAVGVAARGGTFPGGGDGYGAEFSNNVGTPANRIYRWDDDSNLDTDTTTRESGDLKFETDGSTLTCYHNGVSVMTATDTTFTGGAGDRKAAITAFGSVVSTNDIAIDNFSTGDLAGGAAFIKMVGNNFRLAGAGGLAS